MYILSLTALPAGIGTPDPVLRSSKLNGGHIMSLGLMSVLVSFAVFYTVTDALLWDVPGDVLAAPASALCGWNGVILSFS